MINLNGNQENILMYFEDLPNLDNDQYAIVEDKYQDYELLLDIDRAYVCH